MQGRGSGRRRGFAIAAVVMSLSVAAPMFAYAPAGAAPRIARAAKAKRPLTAKQRAKIAAALRKRAATKAAGGYVAPVKHKVSSKSSKRAAAIRRALARRAGTKGKGKSSAARKAAARKAAARKAAARKAANKSSSHSLSLPLLALMALSPFVLVGAGLLIADYMRNRTPRPRRRRRASLVITRVGDR